MIETENPKTTIKEIAMKQYYLGIEFGSTRVKAVLIDGEHRIVKSGDYTWKSSLENGVWTYHMEDVQTGLRTAHPQPRRAAGSCFGHGHFRPDARLSGLRQGLEPAGTVRTWQNTMTGEAAEQLTAGIRLQHPTALVHCASVSGRSERRSARQKYRAHHDACRLCPLSAHGRKRPRRG